MTIRVKGEFGTSSCRGKLLNLGEFSSDGLLCMVWEPAQPGHLGEMAEDFGLVICIAV